ncbi:uncharacterized protein LOC130932914 [Arachis stenosperma]|uniref:uncharacterized protein LOC130932914 n=1 Tax=Arachis stenosperma TaxID=217475 RepID=UPI0025AC1E9F|nr:uncharacterized protein LOC130932914 [Arachis stenosperma]
MVVHIHLLCKLSSHAYCLLLLLLDILRGHTSQENRSQCLKGCGWREESFQNPLFVVVSGNWTPIIVQHMLPVRESNSSFQFPGFCMPQMFKNEDEEGRDSDRGNFETDTCVDVGLISAHRKKKNNKP